MFLFRVLDSFLIQQPSRYFSETLTASKFINTTVTQVNDLMNKYHNIETFVRKSLALAIGGVLERQIELQSFSAEEKFRILLKRSPMTSRAKLLRQRAPNKWRLAQCLEHLKSYDRYYLAAMEKAIETATQKNWSAKEGFTLDGLKIILLR